MQESDHVMAIGAINDLKKERVSGWRNGCGEGRRVAHVGGLQVEVGCPEGHVCCEIRYA